MATEQGTPDPGPAEFDRIVARLRAESPGFAAQRRFEPPVEPPVEPRGRRAPGDGRAPDDGPFVLGCLVVIIPMSMIVGGWIGLVAMATAVMIAARLAVHAVGDSQR